MPTMPFGLSEFKDKWVYKFKNPQTGTNTVEIWSKDAMDQQDFPPGPVDKTHKDENFGRWRAENLPANHPHKDKALDRINKIAVEKAKKAVQGPPDKLVTMSKARVLETHVEAALAKKNAREV